MPFARLISRKTLKLCSHAMTRLHLSRFFVPQLCALCGHHLGRDLIGF
jgi:hypothetical protein